MMLGSEHNPNFKIKSVRDHDEAFDSFFTIGFTLFSKKIHSFSLGLVGTAPETNLFSSKLHSFYVLYVAESA